TKGASMTQQRSLGPFSGLQLTSIITTWLDVIRVPGTAFAVDTFSNVAVEDPVSGVKASVDSQHRLKTLDTVSGALTATPTAPAKDRKSVVKGKAVGSCTRRNTMNAGTASIRKSGPAKTA